MRAIFWNNPEGWKDANTQLNNKLTSIGKGTVFVFDAVDINRIVVDAIDDGLRVHISIVAAAYSSMARNGIIAGGTLPARRVTLLGLCVDALQVLS